MKVLVAYASRHGATKGIAERIAATIERHDIPVTFRDVDRIGGPIDGFDAIVLGSSVYMGRWEKSAREFVQEYVETLKERPTWLFSSGPVGTETVDKEGRDVVETSRPLDYAEFEPLFRPRDQKVFFGAYDPEREGATLAEKLIVKIPAIREALPSGDFRDWPAIEAWAEGIVEALTREAVPA